MRERDEEKEQELLYTSGFEIRDLLQEVVGPFPFLKLLVTLYFYLSSGSSPSPSRIFGLGLGWHKDLLIKIVKLP